MSRSTTNSSKRAEWAFILTVMLALLMFPFPANTAGAASTCYVAKDGSDSDPGTAERPWGTFAHAFESMAAGDELVVRDGTYTERIHDPVSGTPSRYTTVRAEHDGAVTIDGSYVGEWESALDAYDRRYIRLEGIKFKGGRADGTGNSAAFVNGCDHIKILRCAFFDPSTRSAVEDPGGTNYHTFSMARCGYSLLEDCWAWGYGRYKFEAYESDHVIFRRCVARYDRMKAHYPMAVFAIYSSPYNQLQNCMAVDSDQDAYYTGIEGDSEGFYGGILSPNNIPEFTNTGLKMLGCIVLNVSGGQGCGSLLTYGPQTVKDTVVWDSRGGIAYGVPNQASVNMDHVTAGAIYGTHDDLTPAGGVGAICWSDGMNTSVKNSLFTGNNEYGIFDLRNSDYNDFWANRAGDYGNSYGYDHTVPGPHDRYADPGLKYIVRVEDGSPLKGKASDGGDIGATVLKRYGVSGTLWGEPGYESLTAEDLWPWPNEDRIRSDMRSYAGPPSGARGFCADGTSLTRYIWEYLGNPMPSVPSRKWYFAEGTTRRNAADGTYEEWICLGNPGDGEARVTLTYMLGDGTTRSQATVVGPRSRKTVSVNDFIGPDRDVSTVVESDRLVIAERPMYFNYRNKWTGGHDVVGLSAPRRTFYFAEGTTRANADDGRFEQWLCIQNPGARDAQVTVTYLTASGKNIEKKYRVGRTGRKTVDVNRDVGPDKDISIILKSTEPVVAERPMYFNYRNKWTGGHDVVGAPGPSNEFYFAEGTTRDNPTDGSFEEWVCLENPGDADAHVTITYCTTGAGVEPQKVTVGKKSRKTVDAGLKLGANVDASLKVKSDRPVLAERPMYFNYHSKWTGGHDVVGCGVPKKRFYFAEGTTRAGFSTWLSIMNPGDREARVTFRYLLADGSERRAAATVQPRRRYTRDVLGDVGPDRDVSTVVESDREIVAERPMYFDYHGWCTGGHDTVGYGE